VTVAAFIVAALALAFTLASFWWLNARRGSLEVARPAAYAFASKVRLRLPLVFYNTGAKALIVTNLQVVVDDPTREPLHWITTRASLRPHEKDGMAYSTPFAVPGRGTRELIAEFGSVLSWSPERRSKHRLTIEAQLHPDTEWVALASFDWWAPPWPEKMEGYLTYSNIPGLRV
jgi:hypothetical protein